MLDHHEYLCLPLETSPISYGRYRGVVLIAFKCYFNFFCSGISSFGEFREFRLLLFCASFCLCRKQALHTDLGLLALVSL